MTRPISIYLAGKVHGSKWEMSAAIPLHLASFVASDGNNHSNHDWGWGAGLDQMTSAVEEYALEPIRQSDMLVAYLNCATSFGSIAEIAYAAAFGIPCRVYVEGADAWKGGHGTEEEHRIADALGDAYWFVCSIPGVTLCKVTGTAEAARDLTLHLSRLPATIAPGR